MARYRLPDAAYIREALDYDAATGAFRWRTRPLSHFKNASRHKMWNRRWPGQAAGFANVHNSHRVIITINNVHYKAHRLAWLLTYGKPVPAIIDHIDGNPRNNRLSNLRAASAANSSANTARPNTNTSGVKGVRLSKETGRFEAFIGRNGKTFWLGRFHTLEEAAAARRKAADRLHREFARHD